MSRRQALRSMADLITKCEVAHIQLPQDPFAARAEAVEAIIHSGKNGKVNLSDAQEELVQKFGMEPAWKQQLAEEDSKRQHRRAARQKKGATRGKPTTRLAQANIGLGLLPESPPSDDSQKIEAPSPAQKNHAAELRDSAQTLKTNTPKKRMIATAQTPLKQLAAIPGPPTQASMGTISPKLPSNDKDPPRSLSMKVAKKTKRSRSLIVPGPLIRETEKKKPASVKKSVGDAAVLDTNDDQVSPGSGGDQEIIGFLEEVEDAEVASDNSSDEDFTL